MFRTIAIAAMLALGLPLLAAAQPPPGKPPPGKGAPPPAKPAPHGPPPGPHGPPPGPHGPPLAGPHPGPGPGPGGRFTFHGRPFNRAHLAPFVYPPGWGYRRWGIGLVLPGLFLAPAYYYNDWGALGLPPPDPGFQWVRYGPDLLLVNILTGQIVDVIYGAFY